MISRFPPAAASFPLLTLQPDAAAAWRRCRRGSPAQNRYSDAEIAKAVRASVGNPALEHGGDDERVRRVERRVAKRRTG